ncbi:MAG: hypothetical protein GYA23_07705 [Methanomicrobiales archaeon]|nr:hypothetical protein [Methanomicrobiales archaeon]
MGSYKHIEHLIGDYIAHHYARAIEVGIGRNSRAAEMLAHEGVLLRCTDVKDLAYPPDLHFVRDDIFDPAFSIYEGADVIFAIRPAIEMIPALVTIASHGTCDLLVYHLGFEIYENGGEKIDCGVILHRYVKGSEPVKKG